MAFNGLHTGQDYRPWRHASMPSTAKAAIAKAHGQLVRIVRQVLELRCLFRIISSMQPRTEQRHTSDLLLCLGRSCMPN